MSETHQKDPSDRHWYALYTRSRHERKVEKQLRGKGIEAYLPMRRVLRQWSDRKKWVEEPLFRCYVFVYGDQKERYLSVQTIGTVRMISFNGKPVIVQDFEIQRIRAVLREAPSAESCEEIHKGDWVEITRGPLIGLQGRLESIQNRHRLVVTIDSIGQAVRFNVEIGDVRILTRN
jgi:transcription antitermination factor NusG